MVGVLLVEADSFHAEGARRALIAAGLGVRVVASLSQATEVLDRDDVDVVLGALGDVDGADVGGLVALTRGRCALVVLVEAQDLAAGEAAVAAGAVGFAGRADVGGAAFAQLVVVAARAWSAQRAASEAVSGAVEDVTLDEGLVVMSGSLVGGPGMALAGDRLGSFRAQFDRATQLEAEGARDEAVLRELCAQAVFVRLSALELVAEHDRLTTDPSSCLPPLTRPGWCGRHGR